MIGIKLTALNRHECSLLSKFSLVLTLYLTYSLSGECLSKLKCFSASFSAAAYSFYRTECMQPLSMHPIQGIFPCSDAADRNWSLNCESAVFFLRKKLIDLNVSVLLNVIWLCGRLSLKTVKSMSHKSNMIN